MDPSGPTVAISWRGRLTTAKYWGKSLVTMWTTLRGLSGGSKTCWLGLLLRKDWWNGDEEPPTGWWFSLDPDLDPLPWSPDPGLQGPPGTGEELVVDVPVDDNEALLSSIKSCKDNKFCSFEFWRAYLNSKRAQNSSHAPKIQKWLE
jgi:hypothetical protein